VHVFRCCLSALLPPHRSLDAWVDHIAFPFYSGGRIVNIKYRALPKHFQQSAGGQQVFYGLDDIIIQVRTRNCYISHTTCWLIMQ
jgi:hypothetical protein